MKEAFIYSCHTCLIYFPFFSPVGYPFALVYRCFLFHQSATVVHLFHTFSGLALAMFNFGEIENEGVRS